MSPREVSYKFQDTVQERAWRMKNRAEHPWYGKIAQESFIFPVKHTQKLI